MAKKRGKAKMALKKSKTFRSDTIYGSSLFLVDVARGKNPLECQNSHTD
jgi:hypothetical protein